MARKKRIPETNVLPVGGGNKPNQPVFYQDKFQEKTNQQIADVSRRFEGKGKTLVYALGAVAVLAVLLGIFYSFSRRSSTESQTALGKAIETSQAPVTSLPVPAGSTERVFKTEKERAEAAIAEFQAVADKYGSPTREKAQYFIAVNRMSIDRATAQQELENLSKTSGEVGTLSKFALAQARQGDGKLDEAVALYSDLEKSTDSVISKTTINFALAGIYEKQGKKTEAADLYFKIADEATKAKDIEGKPIPLTQTAREAKDKLQTLDPQKAAQIKEEPPALPDAS
jgi:predicted negative regulator of RcsB-dependent stress response